MIGILLAAGRGTRMKSDTSKVLFSVNDEPLCMEPFRAIFDNCDKILVVIGYRGPQVQEALQKRGEEIYGHETFKRKVSFFTQDPPAGTGDAVRVAMQGLSKGLRDHEDIVIVNGDLPLFRSLTLKNFVTEARRLKLSSACLSVRPPNPNGLGRILRDDRGVFVGIREERDASADQKKIREVNGGVYYFQTERLVAALSTLQANNDQKEFYLTDLLGNGKARSEKSEAIGLRSHWDLWGVNNTYELAAARKLAQARLQKRICVEYGVELHNPETTFISARAKFTGSCTIGQGAMIVGACEIHKGVVIEGNCRIEDTRILEDAHIYWGSVLEASIVGPAAKVGPMARLRPGSELGAEVKIGNFVELKKTKMAARSKASHLTYLGDAEVGEDSNIGCGTITCNYDGVNKYRTIIGQRSFIGSDTQLVAPVVVGDDAYVASGTTLTQDVPSGALALARAELTVKPGYAKKLAEKLKAKKAK